MRRRRTARRSAARRGAAVVGAVLVASGCGTAPPPGAPTVRGLTCTVVVADADAAARALDGATAGATVCVTGEGVRGADLVVARSGTPERPVTLVSDGAPVRSVTVVADAVVVEGFRVEDGAGIELRGRDLTVRANEVRGAGADGIACETECRDVVIEDNTVVGTDGSGILVEGQDISVRGNTVSGSVRIESGDADGIRFFGTGLEITGNTVTDISDDGYAEDPPHTDCFQTYDNSRIPTVDALVADNVCRDVDHQCLIATAEEAGTSGELGRSHGLAFLRNTCEVGGSQAVLVRWFPDVEVRGNTLAGPGLDRAAAFLDGSTGGVFLDNSVPGDVLPWEVDDASAEGFRTDVPR